VFEGESDIGLTFFVVYGTGESEQDAGLHPSGFHYPLGFSLG
jgi:hypothetical protein